MDPTLVGLWTAGWARSRGVAPPEPRFGGWYVDVGLPEQTARYVFPALDPERLRPLAAGIHEPAIFLKICTSVEQVLPLLPEGWRVAPRSYFMAVPAHAMETAKSVPAGYRLSLQREESGYVATVTDEAGALAAHGRMVLEQGHAIFDRIETNESYRRRGLGSTVMRALQAQALHDGAKGGLLVATQDGERLYAGLGWTILSDYTSAFIPPASPAAAFTR